MIFGQEAIEYLLPHRHPFLMVEAVTSYTSSETPGLVAMRRVRGDEEVFNLNRVDKRWPAVYVLEGLGQACSLLNILWVLEREMVTRGLEIEQVFDALMNRQGGPDSERYRTFIREGLKLHVFESGMMASVEVEVTGCVVAGDVVQYEVIRSHGFRGLSRFSVNAHVEGHTVVQGVIVGARLEEVA